MSDEHKDLQSYYGSKVETFHDRFFAETSSLVNPSPVLRFTVGQSLRTGYLGAVIGPPAECGGKRSKRNMPYSLRYLLSFSKGRGKFVPNLGGVDVIDTSWYARKPVSGYSVAVRYEEARDLTVGGLRILRRQREPLEKQVIGVSLMLGFFAAHRQREVVATTSCRVVLPREFVSALNWCRLDEEAYDYVMDLCQSY